jgi:hypothetical protein
MPENKPILKLSDNAAYYLAFQKNFDVLKAELAAGLSTFYHTP